MRLEDWQVGKQIDTQIREYASNEDAVVGISRHGSRPVLHIFDPGYRKQLSAAVDLIDTIEWVKKNMPELLAKEGGKGCLEGLEGSLAGGDA